ncbi:MAG: leucine-rich repeat domain-containing protein, partial [Clostridia bacterium]|nr:leucine-rich repeat domain-containing protein [Clostridia bacterium]
DGGDGGKGDYYPGGDMGDDGFDPEGDGHHHSMVYHPSNYAGCADVSPEYWHCSSCGKDYFDPDGYDEIPDPSILDVDHIYGEWISEVPADCTNEGTVAHYCCQRCGKYFDSSKNELDSTVIEAGHEYGEWIEEKAATCESDGNVGHYHCERCGYNFDSDKRFISNVIIPASHSLGSWIAEIDKKCDRDGTLGHYHCSACGKDFDRNNNELASLVIPASHTFGEWLPEVPAVCTDGSIAHYHCSACNKDFDEEKLLIESTLIRGWHDYVDGACSKCGAPDGNVYTLAEGGNAYIISDYTGNDTRLKIPAKYKGLPVVGICEDAFDGSWCFSNLRSIFIPDSITYIEESAFYCQNLDEVHIDDLAAWCKISFANECSTPSYIASSGNIYLNGELLTELVIPTEITEIKDYTFINTAFDSLTVHDGVTAIGVASFRECTFTRATLGEGLESIGERAFSQCSLSEITLGNNVTSIGSSAFYNCYKLSKVTLGNNLTSIGDEAFRSCYSLLSIEIPEKVESIGKSAFDDCDYLVEIINKSSIQITAGDTGYEQVIEVHSGESKLVTVGDYVFFDGESENYLVYYTGDSSSITLPDGFEGEDYAIHNYVFRKRSVQSVDIPDCVTAIGTGAFY